MESIARYIARVMGPRKPRDDVTPAMIEAGQAVHGNALDGRAVADIYRAMAAEKGSAT